MQWNDNYSLNHDQMDQTHQEFIELLEQLNNAKGDEFVTQFQTFKEHTKKHFDQELEWMQQTGFSSTAEHNEDHQRILGELTQLEKRLRPTSLPLVKAYLKDRLPQWFELHILTMDSALAAHLNKK
jgi:hemerythrin-like metal-binding protein